MEAVGGHCICNDRHDLGGEGSDVIDVRVVHMSDSSIDYGSITSSQQLIVDTITGYRAILEAARVPLARWLCR